jgi:hypothetical protein
VERRWTLAAIGLSAAVAALAIAPVLAQPARAFLCGWGHPDCLGNHWLLRWVAERVAGGRSLLHNDAYYWPVGDAPWLAGNGNEGFLYLPFHLLLGWPLGANLYLFSILVLNGVAAFVLARAAGASAPSALPAATTGATLVYAMHELGAGRFSQVSVCWLAFFLASWIDFCRHGGRGRGLRSAGLLALASVQYWYYGFFGVMAGAIVLGWRRPRPGELAGFAVLFACLVAPVAAIYAQGWTAIPGTGEALFPHPEAVGDSALPAVPFLVRGGRFAGQALPFSTVVFAVAALALARDRLTWVLAAVAAWFAALAAGAAVESGPFCWVYGLAAPLRRFWWPYRHVVVENLALVALAAVGTERLARGRAWVGIAVAISIPMQLELQGPPWRPPWTAYRGPSLLYAAVRAQPGALLLEPPIASQVASSQALLLYQPEHGKTLIAGHGAWVDRVRPRAWDAFIAGNTFLSMCQALERGELDGSFAFRAADLRALVDHGLGTVAVNPEYFPARIPGLVVAYEAVLDALFGAPFVEERGARAWSTRAWTGADHVAFPPFSWPADLAPGGPTLAIQSPRFPSLSMSSPAPRR